MGAVAVAIKLWHLDKRFRLHVCYPDYVRNAGMAVIHPAIIWHGNVQNSSKLWELFNRCGVLPYTSTFMEPSSRAHRQAQAAGSLVLYPPAMGTPSDLIENHRTGIVEPVHTWVDYIHRSVEDGSWQKIGNNAREMAVSENWAVQAKRFNELIARLRGEV